MAGVLFLARFGGVDANAGIGYELPVVAACVVGGVNIFGGTGTVLGALLGAMLLKTMGVSLSALSVPEFWQQAINGLLLLVAITADRFVFLRRERRQRRGGPARAAGGGEPTPRRSTCRPAARRPTEAARWSRWITWDRSVFALLVLTVVVGALVDPNFAGGSNLGFVLQDIGEIMLIALPMTFLIMTGEIDLSVASTAALAGCVLGWAWQASAARWRSPPRRRWPGVVCGAVNGFLVTRLGLGSLAVTIGTLGAVPRARATRCSATPRSRTSRPAGPTSGSHRSPGRRCPYVTPSADRARPSSSGSCCT